MEELKINGQYEKEDGKRIMRLINEITETVNKIMKTIPQKIENGKELRQCVNCGKWFEPCWTTFDESGKRLNVCGEFTCSYDCTEELSRKDVI